MIRPTLCIRDRLRPVLCEQAGLKEEKLLWEEMMVGRTQGVGMGNVRVWWSQEVFRDKEDKLYVVATTVKLAGSGAPEITIWEYNK